MGDGLLFGRRFLKLQRCAESFCGVDAKVESLVQRVARVLKLGIVEFLELL